MANHFATLQIRERAELVVEIHGDDGARMMAAYWYDRRVVGDAAINNELRSRNVTWKDFWNRGGGEKGQCSILITRCVAEPEIPGPRDLLPSTEREHRHEMRRHETAQRGSERHINGRCTSAELAEIDCGGDLCDKGALSTRWSRGSHQVNTTAAATLTHAAHTATVGP